MKVRQLRAALRGLPGDMDVCLGDTSPTDGIAVAIMRFHYAAPLHARWSRYTDALWLAWSGEYQKFSIADDGRVVNEMNGYKPTLQRVLADDNDAAGPVRWKVTDETKEPT